MTDSDDLMDRFPDGEVEQSSETGQTGHTGETDTTEHTTDTRTRSRSQYPMYLSEDLQDELDDTFKRENAERTLDGRDEIEKHKDFLEAVVREGLDGDWEGRLE